MARKKNGGFAWGTFFAGVGTAFAWTGLWSVFWWRRGVLLFRNPKTGEIRGHIPEQDNGDADVPKPTPDDPLEGQGEPQGTLGGGPTAVQVDQPEGSVFETHSKQGWGDFTILLRPMQVEGPGETQVAWQWLVWEPTVTTLAEGNTAGQGQRVGQNALSLARADAQAYVDMWGGEAQASLAD